MIFNRFYHGVMIIFKNPQLDFASLITLAVMAPVALCVGLSYLSNLQAEMKDDVNKNIVVTSSMNNDKSVTINVRNTFDKNIKNITFDCKTKVLSGDVVTTSTTLFDTLAAGTQKSIVITQLTRTWNNVPLDIGQIKDVTCKVSDMQAQDGSNIYART